MTSDEHRDSLADQAAAWVPPWARERSVEPSAPPEPPEPGEAADEPVAAGPEEPEPVAAGPEEPESERAEPWSESAATAFGEPEITPVAALPEPVEPTGPEPVTAPVGEEPGPAAATERFGPVEETAPTESIDLPEAAGQPVPGSEEAARSEPARGRGATPALIDDAELGGALEAILLVVDEPVTETVLAQVLEQPTDRVAAALRSIAAGYTASGHGFELRRAAGGWRLYTRPEYATYVERFVLDGQSVRLTQAALETLAVVAYKQPVTRSRISAIRGVNCDGVIRTLVSRGLIEESGSEPDSGAFLYRTTTLFLEKLGLDRVDELPPLAPFLPDDVEEMTDAPR